MSIDLDRKRLSKAKMLENMPHIPKMTEMIDVYCSFSKSDNSDSDSSTLIYCTLVSSDGIDQALSSPLWDLFKRDTMPSGGTYHGEPKYLRYGFTDTVEPLVLFRTFYDLHDEYIEICEEFRLFHNLHHNRQTDEYIKIDDDGNEFLVAVVKPNRVQIRLKEIRQFLAIKEMYLLMQFGCGEFSTYSLKELGFEQGETHQQNSSMHWCHSYSDWILPKYKSFSRLVGKQLIEPLPKSKSDFPGFAEEPQEEYVDFIIGVDEDGDEITNTSEPDSLDHLTPVHFRKEVLDKYYRLPSKYSVEDSILRCGSLWVVMIDNHHDDKVCVWLGDLGRDLPYTEQQHWRLYNIPPKGSVSETYFRRQIMAQFTNSDQPEHLFKQRYNHLQKESEKHLGWQLLRPLNSQDEYHFKSLRIPSTDEQGDFDALVLSLTKILIDSLNQKEIKKLISLEHEQNLTLDQQESLKGSIGWLEIALNSCGVEGAADHIAFLRKLQSLRSSGSAHLKGSDYKKIAKDFGIENKGLREVFAEILSKALDVLDYFIFLIRSRQINREIIEQNSIERGHAILSQMIGIADFDPTDGSVNHDEPIHESDSKP